MRVALSERFRSNKETGVGLDMKSSGGWWGGVQGQTLCEFARASGVGMHPITSGMGLRLVHVSVRGWGGECTPRSESRRQSSVTRRLPSHAHFSVLTPPHPTPPHPTPPHHTPPHPTGAMHPLSSEVVKVCLPGGQRRPFRHNQMALMTVTGA